MLLYFNMSKPKKIYTLVICYSYDSDVVEWMEERIERELELPDNIFETAYIAELDDFLDMLPDITEIAEA